MKNHKSIALCLAKLLQQAQQEQGISQKDLAVAAGVSQSRISEMFSGKYVPLLSTFIKVAIILKIREFSLVVPDPTMEDLGDIREGMSIAELIEYEG